MEASKVDLLREALCEFAHAYALIDPIPLSLAPNTSPAPPVRPLRRAALPIDARLSLSDVSFELLKQLRGLEPFGNANRTPNFISRIALHSGPLVIGRDKTHVRFTSIAVDAPASASAAGSSSASATPTPASASTPSNSTSAQQQKASPFLVSFCLTCGAHFIR
jgi:hypothetical protein